jgi:hypothetical protein
MPACPGSGSDRHKKYPVACKGRTGRSAEYADKSEVMVYLFWPENAVSCKRNGQGRIFINGFKKKAKIEE